MTEKKTGKLTVVGTGMHRGHLTAEVTEALMGADRVLCVNSYNPWLRDLNPVCEDLDLLRAEGKNRDVTYTEMVDRVMQCLRSGERVCFALYGHSHFLVTPSTIVIMVAEIETKLKRGESRAEWIRQAITAKLKK